MADHISHAAPDYDLVDRLVLDADQVRLMLEPTRLRIIELLSERAATTSQLADALERPKGTVGHHCKALETGGLIHVVRTARVRAIEERYYGRTARLFVMGSPQEAGLSMGAFIGDAYAELVRAATPPHDVDDSQLTTVRYARIPQERAAEWSERLGRLADEFAGQARSGDITYGMLIGLYRTDHKGFADD